MKKLITNNESSAIEVIDESFINVEPTETFADEINQAYKKEKITFKNVLINKEKLLGCLDVSENKKLWFRLENIDEFNKMFKQ